MGAIGLFEAKTHLSEYVARAEAGEEVIIMRHNKPVAKIVPLNAKGGVLQRFVQPTFAMGQPLVDLTRANQLAADLEDQEILARMARGA